jgi:hypothetical protein
MMPELPFSHWTNQTAVVVKLPVIQQIHNWPKYFPPGKFISVLKTNKI